MKSTSLKPRLNAFARVALELYGVHASKLAPLLRSDSGNVTRYLAGSQSIDNHRLATLAALFGVTSATLLAPTPHPVVLAAVRDWRASEAAQRAIERFRRLGVVRKQLVNPPSQQRRGLFDGWKWYPSGRWPPPRL